MHIAEVLIGNKMGLHARPAQILARESSKFSSQVTLLKDGKQYNAKSIISLMSMGAICGDKITVQALGQDAGEAINSLVSLIQNNFGE